ncbi:MAG TPA: ribosome maturation factor RimM [Gammaproteobacteria bacterium]|nr:ribosome maturation factor RimM [Gammaproteobacteria bacterium]
MKLQEKPLNNTWILIGKIGRVHGIKGFVSIHSFTEPSANIINYHPWYDKNKKPLNIVECKLLGKKIIALFDEKQKPATNEEIWIERTQLPALKKDEYYWTDLIGLDVYNLEKKFLGKIVDIFNTGANDIVVVKNQEHKKEILIPYIINRYIMEINLIKKVMRVDWHEI